MAVHGHSQVLDALRTNLPPASLFLGPYSVGRWSAAEHLRWHHGVHPDDVLRVRLLDAETSQTIREFTLTPPARSPFKLVIIELYKAKAAAKESLASVLENPHHAKVIVIAMPSEAVPSLIERSVVFRFRFLSAPEVAAVLEEKMNFSTTRAEALAERSGGTVAGALTLADSEASIDQAKEAIHALRSHDADALEELASKWTDEATAWVAQWCNETISQQWRVFDQEDYVESKSLPLRILIALRPKVRPRLVVRSQLMSVLRGDT